MKRALAVFLFVTLLLFAGCATPAHRVIEVPVSRTIEEMMRSPQFDGFGSNFTSGMLLQSLGKERTWHTVVGGSLDSRQSESLRKSWRVRPLGWREEGKLILRKFEVSVSGDSGEDTDAALDKLLAAFDAACRRQYSDEFAPYVRTPKDGSLP